MVPVPADATGSRWAFVGARNVTYVSGSICFLAKSAPLLICLPASLPVKDGEKTDGRGR